MQIIYSDLLWIGNACDLRNPKSLFDACISAVVDVAYEEEPARLPRELLYCRFPIFDGSGNDAVVLRQSVQTIVDLLGARTRTIVTCSAGMSRSPAIAAAALAVHLGDSPDAVIQRIGDAKGLEVSSSLWSELLSVLSEVRTRN